MSRFFTETSSSHTNSSTAHEAMCKDFKKFFLGFLSVDSSGFNGFDDHPQADIRLAFFNTLSSSFIDTLQQTLAPMMVSYVNKPGVSHLFLNTRQLPDEHPLWTQEGRLDFYSEFMNNLIQATIEEIKNHPIPDEGQTFIARLSEEMPHFTEEKILGLLKAYFNVFQKDFHASTAFERKYQILESLVQLQIPLSYYGHFRDFITYREQCHLNWLFNQSPFSSLPPEMAEEIKSHLISPTNR